jgi:hypothetical protein
MGVQHDWVAFTVVKDKIGLEIYASISPFPTQLSALINIAIYKKERPICLGMCMIQG